MMAKISESLETRWPRPDDRLLGKAGSWNSAIAFSDNPAERHALMLKGYFRAGDVLVDSCLKNLNEGHTLIYPILLCYRHALEMTMKGILDSYGHHYGVAAPKPNHSLLLLWEACKAIFTQIDDEGAAISTSAVEKLIKEFHDLDARAEAFRYPEKKDGTLIDLPDYPFDLIGLRDVIEGLKNFFSGADGYLNHLCSASDEMRYY
jgi:hypothetical protein